MTIPYREWTHFDVVTLEGHDVVDAAFDGIDNWTSTYQSYGIIGGYEEAATNWWIWFTLIRPSADDFELSDGADFPVSYLLQYSAMKDNWAAGAFTKVRIDASVMNENLSDHRWLSDKANGKYTDGVSEQWDNYPIWEGAMFGEVSTCPGVFLDSELLRSSLHTDTRTCPFGIEAECPGKFGATAYAYAARERFFRNGLSLRVVAFWDGAWKNVNGLGIGTKITVAVVPNRIKVKYFNPVTNSLSTYQVASAGGDELIISGLGFDNSDADINEYCGTPAWNNDVDSIQFVGLQGQGVTTITLAGGDYTIDSNSQITISAMPALVEGTYHVNLIKGDIDPGTGSLGSATGYAGEWRCDEEGRMHSGERFILLVWDDEVPDKPPEVRTKWKWKYHDGEVFAYYAPLDTRGTETFWEGRIKNVAPIFRGIDDKTGLFSISDTAVTLANSDMEMSKMLTRYFLKYQEVEFYHGWGEQPEAWQSYVFSGIVDDYDFKGPHFEVLIKDVTQKYFRMKVPQYFCTAEADDYPNIHNSSIGRSRPEILGECSLVPAVAGDAAGAVEAVYVDTTTYSYLAANSSLRNVTQVYSDNVLQTAGVDYTIGYRDGGRTYIDFTADQGDNKITFNCEGYSVPIWDDPVNGYIQNPAYIISFFLTQIVGMPINLLDMNSFDTLATLYTNNNWHQAGKLIIETERDAMEVLKELLFSFGASLWIAKDGRLTVGRKDVSNYSTDIIIFDQIHAFDHAERKYNLRDAVNFANAKWDYIPTHNLFKDAKEESSASSIEDFEKEISPSSPWEFKWNVSDDLADQRLREELLKYAYGYRKMRVTVSIDWIDDLDIFTNFRYQDPFGLSWTKGGEEGRYYYVASLTYDFQNQSIEIEAIDMQYIIGQCVIVGNCDELEADRDNATEWMKMFGYVCVCDTGRFPNGDPCQKVCKCPT